MRQLLNFILLVHITFLCGCMSMHTFRKVDVSVIDAETGEAVPHAEVSTECISLAAWNVPANAVVTTSEEGTATFKVANFKGGPTVWKANATGYLEQKATADRGTRIPLAFAKLSTDKTKPATVLIKLFQGPAPSLKVIVPNDYLGPLRIDLVPVESKTQAQTGKRDFVCYTDQYGYAQVAATELIQIIQPEDYVIQTEDGETYASKDLRDREAGLRSVYTTEENTRFFVIGTWKEKQFVGELIDQMHTWEVPDNTPNENKYLQQKLIETFNELKEVYDIQNLD